MSAEGVPDNSEQVIFTFEPPVGAHGVSIDAAHAVMAAFVRMVGAVLAADNGLTPSQPTRFYELQIITEPEAGSIRFRTVLIALAAALQVGADVSQVTGVTLANVADRLLHPNTVRPPVARSQVEADHATLEVRRAAAASLCAPVTIEFAGQTVVLVGSEYRYADIGADGFVKDVRALPLPDLIQGNPKDQMEVMVEGRKRTAFVASFKPDDERRERKTIAVIWGSKRAVPDTGFFFRVNWGKRYEPGQVTHAAPASSAFRHVAAIVEVTSAVPMEEYQ